MIRLCDGSDDYSQDKDGSPCRCGRRYDDVDRYTIWPHDGLPPGGVTVVMLGAPEAQALVERLITQLRGEVRDA